MAPISLLSIKIQNEHFSLFITSRYGRILKVPQNLKI